MFKAIVLSDYHLGASHLTEYHQKNTIELFLYPELNNTVDMLIISGDFFDTSLLFDSNTAIISTIIISDLCKLCKSNDIALRILRGTYSHDRDQLKQFVEIAKNYKLDVKYFDTISVDSYKDYTFLYLPDTLPYKDGKSILKDAYTLYKATYNNSYPDIVIGHGYFSHRLPEAIKDHKPPCCYDTDDFKNSRIVIFGHEHHHWNVDNVYSCGSFDRLIHGEEEPKGYMIFNIDDDYNVSTRFIENKLAMPHITIHPYGNTIDEKLDYIITQVDKLFPHPPHGYLRIKDNTEDRLTLVSLLKDKYSSLVITSIAKLPKIKSEQKSQLSLGFTIYHSDIPQIDTIGELLWDYLINTRNEVTIPKTSFLQEIEEVKQNVI